MMKRTVLLLIVLIWACSLWEYEDPSSPTENQPPETYLSLIASDTIYAEIASIDTSFDSTSGKTVYDTTWAYYLGEDPDSGAVVDTFTSAFKDIFTSQQQLHWWGEDRDGYVIAYLIKWNVDADWDTVTVEDSLFYVPIRTELDIFSFEVSAMDDDSLVDPTPARIVLPITNSNPTIDFRYRSNPFSSDLRTDTSFTFPTRTFVWDVQDLDGVETITDIFYALDDTCDTCWSQLDAAAYSSITLTDITPGLHTFYVKARDIAGAESETIQFPDPANDDEPNYWRVLPVIGDVLLVDDFWQDSKSHRFTHSWFRSIMDSLVGEGHYSVWEIGERLPYSSTDVTANLNYFDHVIWYSAYTGTITYNEASTSIYSYVLNGGNIFLNITQVVDTSFVWFPLKSSYVINPVGRLFTGRVLESTVSPELDLQVSTLIAVRVNGFVPDSSEFASITELYHLQAPESGDQWSGTPTVCSMGQFEVSQNQLSGKIVLMTIPFHNGYYPTLEGQGSSVKFFDYLLNDVFVND